MNGPAPIGGPALAPVHAPMQQFLVSNDSLQVGAWSLDQLARRVGSTPFYVYGRRQLQQRVAMLRDVLPAGVDLHYAMKANPMPALVQLMAGLVDGLDVASGGELKTALDTAMVPARISFAGPGKTDAELGRAIAAGVLINVESAFEMERIARQGQQQGLRPRIALRINPDFELKHAGMKMGGGPRPFGIDQQAVPDVLRRMGALDLEFAGFHIYTGSQNLSAPAIAEAQRLSVQLALQLAPLAPGPMQVLNIGGGCGVPYFPGEKPLDIDAVADSLARQQQLLHAASPHTRLVIELGRYLVAEAGLYVCRVLERKVSHGQVFLVTDGGLHHHLAASGNFGQVIRKNYPVVIGNRVHGGAREIASVVGPLCTPLDLLADRLEMARADTGDLVAVFQSGAYGLTASPSAFLGHPAATEVLV